MQSDGAPVMHIKSHILHLMIIFLPAVFLAFIAWGPVHGAAPDSRRAGGPALRLTLEEAVSLALRSNRNIGLAANSVRSSELSLQGARSAFDLKYRPAGNIGAADGEAFVEAGMAVEKRLYSGTRMGVTPLVSQGDDATRALVDLSVEIPLLRGRGAAVNRDAVDQSAYSLRSSGRSLHLSRVDTVIQTVSAIYGILEQREVIALLEEQVREMAVHVETARMKKQVELADAMDVYRALIRLKDVQDSLSAARSGLSRSRNSLKRILALPLDQQVDVSAPFTIRPVSYSLAAAIDAALKNRKEIAQAEDALAEAERRAGVARDDLSPDLDLVLDYERVSQTDDFGFGRDRPEDRWQINLVSSTDWARTREKARYRQDLLDVANARLRIQARRDQIIAEVRNQLEVLENWRDRIRIKKEQVRQARGKQKLSQIKFKHSMADNFDLVEAESELFRARAGLAGARAAYIVNQYRLRAVMGNLLNAEGKLDLEL